MSKIPNFFLDNKRQVIYFLSFSKNSFNLNDFGLVKNVDEITLRNNKIFSLKYTITHKRREVSTFGTQNNRKFFRHKAHFTSFLSQIPRSNGFCKSIIKSMNKLNIDLKMYTKISIQCYL